jgi:acyl-CoA synthetase (AMP-forming)/AMP-acid ligase II
MPLYHSSASILAVCNTTLWAAAIAIGTKFSAQTFWRDVRRYDATIIQYVGEICRYLTVAPAEYDRSTGECLDRRHRVRVACGNGLRPDVWDRFKTRFGIPTVFEFYSATEAAGGSWNLSRNEFSRGAIGRYGVLSYAYMSSRCALAQLADDNETPWRDPTTGFCRRVPVGRPGEVLFKLPELDIESAFQGYFRNNKATSAKVLRDVFVRGDAWFRTGDTARWDTERRLFFVDRIGDTFRWKSENVSTAEVSEALGMHPAVREANVYGVELPHHDGRAGCVAIVLDTATGTGEPDPELLRSLAEHASRSLPRYAVPIFLRVERDVGMQNTATYKQQKTALRQQGVEPGNVDGDKLFWLRNGRYEPFTEAEWRSLQEGAVKL